MVNSFEFCSIHFSKKFRSTVFNTQYAVYGSKNENISPPLFYKNKLFVDYLGGITICSCPIF